MIRSMTAFARISTQTQWGEVCWELRAVNHRYLEISPRLPEEFRVLETRLRERIAQLLKRGKLDCTLRFQTDTATVGFRLNHTLVQQLLTVSTELAVLSDNPQKLSALDLLNWAGVLEVPAPDMDSLSTPIMATLDKALQQLLAHREREGAQILRMIEQRCEAVTQEISKVRAQLPEIIKRQRERTKARLSELEQNLVQERNLDRLEQEMVFLAQKIDVAEELDRLDAHVLEVQQTLKSDKAIGRRLDFLMQELNREANTLASKSIDTRTTMASVNLKVLIEQMREQVQNIE
ncbi:YicC/YloC family endoribonuclease [Candidatus Venteria ishoeyi]|uniref:YicC-like family, N-terminal region n=1 Tax=Candidatus Venteria ishoeyi TaxID=1899563 RepID=A0A1H6FAB0_9GAMM|nr:YicC/YloC family endoribonuclease [Candidatus Venteria ishoeyi]MDM8547180.1 YicC/YloC family endoribonuclease [Candidatus Venteria ishoeyi]SEH06553.1 Uncharacterised protein [Candidatus Venteria ishoeyi]